MTSDAMETARSQSATDLVSREGRNTPKSGQDRSVLGIKAKLFLAFCAMAGFTILAAAIAWYAFVTIERSVDRITAESVPAMAISLRLAEKSAEIASMAPALAASISQVERISAQTRLEQRSEELASLMHDLRATGIELKTVEDLTAIQADITIRLGALNEAVGKRLRLQVQREIASKGMAAAHGQIVEVLEPLVDDAVFDLVLSGEDLTAQSTRAITGLVEVGIGTIHLLLTVNAEANLAAGLLAEAANASDPVLIQPIRERFFAAAATVERNLTQLPDTAEKAKLQQALEALLVLGSGSDNIFDVRERELRAIASARESLQARRKRMADALKATHGALLDTLTPMVDDATFELVINAEEITTQTTEAITGLVEVGIGTIHLLLTVNAEANLAAGLLAEAANSSDPVLIQPIRERFFAAAATVERNLTQLPDTAEKAKLQQALEALLVLGSGSDNIFDVRERELRAIASARELLQARRKRMADALKATHGALLDTLTPMVDDATFELVINAEEVTTRSTEAITNLIDGGVNTLQVLLALRAEGNLAAGLLAEAANIPDRASIQPVRERFISAAATIKRSLNQLPDKSDSQEVREKLDHLIAFGDGDDGIFSIREQELSQIATADNLLQAARSLSIRLGDQVTALVAAAQSGSDQAALQASQAISDGQLMLLLITAVSVVGAILIVLFYVAPRVVRPLEDITTAMAELAAGDTSVDIPARERRDEIGRMAQALGVFRDTAIEVQKSNLREIHETRRRLTDAIETISEGFSLYDSEDCLVICNSMYRTLLYPDIGDEITPGLTFESIVRRAADQGYIEDAKGRVEEWLEQRLARHRDPSGPHVQQRADGRWIMVSERKTEDGGTVAVYSDITELKQREEELADKSSALEQLSNQLAKYLSPQVYESIFSGRQEVKIASTRKKLTVFFSDIADFTETADKLESEDLTKLLNHYLTEMSQIALEYGATIDKYVGDAIVIFFGDPETRGVKEDALACVKMAIAMRKRLLELGSIWRDSGIEKPLQVRIGINTGYCTVGNIGSEDRMDYTIIGGGVNLTSRLETAATPGEILISYETYAHVKDQIKCEETGEINVKGIAYPVATYQVVDTYDNLSKHRQLIREDHPNLKIDLDLDTMSVDERNRAATVLQRVLDRLSSLEQSDRLERSSEKDSNRAKLARTGGH